MPLFCPQHNLLNQYSVQIKYLQVFNNGSLKSLLFFCRVIPQIPSMIDQMPQSIPPFHFKINFSHINVPYDPRDLGPNTMSPKSLTSSKQGAIMAIYLPTLRMHQLLGVFSLLPLTGWFSHVLMDSF